MTGKKTGGRQAGTPNKLTKELRSVLKDVLHAELETLPKHLNKLTPKERVDAVIKLAPFVLPKVQQESFAIHEPIDWEL